MSPAPRTRSVKDHEVNWTPWSAWTMPPRFTRRCLIAMSRAFTTNCESCVDRPADDAPAAGVHHAAAEDLSLARSVLRDVGDPELVELAAGELALHEVATRGHALDRLDLGGSRKTSDSGVVHEDRDEIHAHVDPAALHQFGMHPS